MADVDMLLMVEKGIRDRMCNVVHWYAKSNRRYMKQACDFSGFLQENLFLSFTYKRGQSQRGGLLFTFVLLNRVVPDVETIYFVSIEQKK